MKESPAIQCGSRLTPNPPHQRSSPLLTEMTAPARVREIPYNYTSLSDREIVIRLLGEKA